MSHGKTEPNVGELATGDVRRDAIHVAVVMATASERLVPGQPVNSAGRSEPPHVGIVDPFLGVPIYPNQRYWLFLKPRTVTSLRHVWTHPAFSEEINESVVSKLLLDKIAGMSESEEWLRGFAASYDETYEDMMAAADAHIERGEYLNRGDKFDGEYVPDDFWDHYQIVRGKKVNGSNFFSCSC